MEIHKFHRCPLPHLLKRLNLNGLSNQALKGTFLRFSKSFFYLLSFKISHIRIILNISFGVILWVADAYSDNINFCYLKNYFISKVFHNWVLHLSETIYQFKLANVMLKLLVAGSTEVCFLCAKSSRNVILPYNLHLELVSSIFIYFTKRKHLKNYGKWYFIEKALFVIEIFKFLFFPLLIFFRHLFFQEKFKSINFLIS